jgi:phage shock protein A
MSARDPKTRDEIKARMAELMTQYDQLAAEICDLEAKRDAAIAAGDLGDILATAEKQLGHQKGIEARRLAMAVIKREFDCLAKEAAALDRAWARAELTKRQPALDKAAAKVATAAEAMRDELVGYFDLVDAIANELPLTPRVVWAKSLIETLEHRLGRYAQEMGG